MIHRQTVCSWHFQCNCPLRKVTTTGLVQGPPNRIGKMSTSPNKRMVGAGAQGVRSTIATLVETKEKDRQELEKVASLYVLLSIRQRYPQPICNDALSQR